MVQCINFCAKEKDFEQSREGLRRAKTVKVGKKMEGKIDSPPLSRSLTQACKLASLLGTRFVNLTLSSSILKRFSSGCGEKESSCAVIESIN